MPPQLIDRAGDMDVAVGVDTNDDPCRLRLCHGDDGRLPSGQGWMARAGRAGGQHCDESGCTGSCQVTFARLVLPWTVTAARADRSQPRHEASKRTGQTRATATTEIIAVKARSRALASQVNRCETAADLYVRCLLLSFAVPQVPPIRGPRYGPTAYGHGYLRPLVGSGMT